MTPEKKLEELTGEIIQQDVIPINTSEINTEHGVFFGDQ